jgi:catechol 2,3-dioxygenase-like lactoylglutathione lyase family enzyme
MSAEGSTLSPRLVPELACTDLDLSLSFYTAILGFVIRYERPEERFAYLEREGAALMLTESTSPRVVTASLEYPRGRGIHLQIAVDNIAALHAAVVAVGTPLYLTLQEKWYRRNDELIGDCHFAVQDPDGYLLRFYEDLGTRPA